MVGRSAAKMGDSELFELYNNSLIYMAPHDFDSFMLALERNRPVRERFWQPRRRKLLPVCHALQDMEEGKLDELFLSCPPRIGKSTLMLMFFLWVMGRDPERSNLYCSYTDGVVNVLYTGILEVLTDPATYAYGDVFPGRSIASTNAKDLLINLDRKKRYASFTGRSLYGTLNGACDCNGYLVGDDLISGIEEAMNKDRLASAWAKVDNNMLPRAKETAKILWIGTRWSLLDPQGIRIDLLSNDPKYADRRWKVLNTPALDSNDESNFDYDYGVGFSSDYYIQRRASFERNSDMASWMAQYMGEPIERDGAVFAPTDMRYYNGELPDADSDRIFMAVDPAWGGGDYVAAPVCVQYGNDIYVVDVVYSNEDKTITQPLIVNAIKKYGVQAVKVEGTKMTASYGEDVDKALRKEDIRVNMQINTKHFTGTGKRTRIFDKAPDIRDHMVFLSDGHRTKEYSQFMQSLFSFTVTGKQAKHDDAADSLAMAIDFAMFGSKNKVEILKRFF
jgi:predicted phage terminase large subunit-like protein